MKKLIAIAASVAMFAGQILNPITISAMMVDDVGGEYWFVPELIEYDIEFEAEIEKRCAEALYPSSCLRFERVKHINADGNRYKAVWQLKHTKMLITAVNPYRSTIRMYYIGADNGSDGEELDAVELYIYWLDTSKTSRRDPDVFVEQFKNGELEDDVHVVYAETRHDDEPLIARREEVRFVLPAGSFTGSTNGTIFYAAVNAAGDIFGGGVSYARKCFTNDNLSVGQECRGSFYMINNTYTYYLAPHDEIDEDKTLDTSPLTAEPESTDEPEEPEIPEEPWSPEDPDTPEEPGSTEEPESPEEPDTPEMPDAPDDLEVPEEPETPEVPDTPEIPETPDATEGEEATGTPDVPEEPAGPIKPSNGPSNLENPKESLAEPSNESFSPGEPEKSEEPRTRDNSENYEEPAIITDDPVKPNEKPSSFEPKEETPKTPNTGEPGSSSSESSWCLPMVISLGIAYVVWWIIPVNKKRKQ